MSRNKSNRFSTDLAELEEGDLLELPPRPAVNIKTTEKYESQYKSLEELGKGKFGTVHRCTRKADGLELAAKFLRKTSSSKKEVLREIEMMNLLHHKRLISLFDAFETSNQMIVIMELVTGGELFEKIVEEDNLSEKQVIRYMRQVLYGVQHMHRKNMVHLDLKPENILCLGGGTPGYEEIKLIDFGMTRVLSKDKDETAMCGTPEFVAPEVITFNPITLASDMWSIGVITYVLLSGLSPFMGDDDNETLKNVTLGEYDFEDDDGIFDAISDDAKTFIEELLDLSPGERLTVDECLQHSWLQGNGSEKKLATKNLKKFIARRRWQRTMNTIKAVSRLAGGLSLFGEKAGAHGSDSKGKFLDRVKKQHEIEKSEEAAIKAKEEAAKRDAEKRKLEAEKKKKEAEELERKKQEEIRRKEAERKKAEEEKKRKEEEEKKRAEEFKRREAEKIRLEEARKKKEKEEAERKRLEEEKRRKEKEEAEKKRLEEARKKKEREEAKKKSIEEERKKKEKEDTEKKRLEEEKKRKEETERRLEEEKRKKQAEIKKQEEDRKRKEEQEKRLAEEKRKQEEAEKLKQEREKKRLEDEQKKGTTSPNMSAESKKTEESKKKEDLLKRRRSVDQKADKERKLKQENEEREKRKEEKRKKEDEKKKKLEEEKEKKRLEKEKKKQVELEEKKRKEEEKKFKKEEKIARRNSLRKKSSGENISQEALEKLELERKKKRDEERERRRQQRKNKLDSGPSIDKNTTSETKENIPNGAIKPPENKTVKPSASLDKEKTVSTPSSKEKPVSTPTNREKAPINQEKISDLNQNSIIRKKYLIKENGYSSSGNESGTNSPNTLRRKTSRPAEGAVANRIAGFQTGDAFWKNKK